MSLSSTRRSLIRPSLFLPRLLKLVAVFVVTTLLIYSSTRLSSRWRFSAVPSFEHASQTYKDCPPNIRESDFSPAAIHCRILAALEAHSTPKTQSSTPEEAIAEYKSRYGRLPPRGFEEWVNFALNHRSEIIDDFDQIDRDLEPYRTPEARQIFRELKEQGEKHPHLVTVRIENGTMSKSGGYIYDREWERLVKPFAHALPDSLFLLSTIDEPRVLSCSDPQPATVQFQERPGESIEDLVKDSCKTVPKFPRRLSHYVDVCRSSHPANLHALIAAPSSFSYTHSSVPILSFGRMSAFKDILFPCPCYLAHPVAEKDPIPFLEKKGALYWRGSSTGGRATRFNWRHGHRGRFVSFIQSLQNAAHVLDAGSFFGLKTDNLNKKQIRLFREVFDVHMAAYVQCVDDACNEMARVLGPPDYESEDTASNYRFVFDLDGNSMSTRFYRLLSRKTVVFKQTWFQEWHDDRLIPWAHYIPVTMTMEELPALINFFVNNSNGEKLSAEIALAGSTWSKKVLREIDMSIYLYRLLLEMAELFNLEETPTVS
ncbi:hypothetical protein HIM_06136 [Hirsutella minnesotensis 3608]|uniref:Glycosyl transferase CAP10 domain-containing protein n=1 Tax=Hirsutella minnesotensis 3608 TaxID=1043627 RepID=A0A0F7ZNY1_9HYPO|nr:hypothetical protein HIM_06136 [Hirsutella minnesotensis 3608]